MNKDFLSQTEAYSIATWKTMDKTIAQCAPDASADRMEFPGSSPGMDKIKCLKN